MLFQKANQKLHLTILEVQKFLVSSMTGNVLTLNGIKYSLPREQILTQYSSPLLQERKGWY